MKYKHLTFEQRFSIQIMLKANTKKKDICKALNIPDSTLYRELKRNCKPSGRYHAKYAQMLADERKKEGHYKHKFTGSMKKYIEKALTQWQWSPKQIQERASKENIDMVSHERIYQYIWQDKATGGTLYKHLRTGNKKYKKRYASKDHRGHIKDRISIDKRPAIVDEKKRIGDLEIDLIIGKNNKGAILTIVDRKTRYLWMEKLSGKNAKEVAEKLTKALIPYKNMIHTITADNGKEFSEHQYVAKKLDIDFYFAHPYSSWERGLNENTNKLIRQYFPKTMHLTTVTDEEIKLVTRKLNERPREKLNFLSPSEAFYNYFCEKLALSG